MYTARSKGAPVQWTTAAARERFADLVRAASERPQRIYSRDRLVAVMVDPITFEAFEAWQGSQKSIGDAFEAIRMVAAEEEWTFEVPDRRDRQGPFDDDAG